MKIENQIKIIKKELEARQASDDPTLQSIKPKLEQLISAVSEYDTNWEGTWASSTYNHYFNFIGKGGGTIILTEDQIKDFIEQKTKYKIQEIRAEINNVSKANRAFQEKVVTELSIIKGKDGFEEETEILKKLENHKWGYGAGEYIRMKTPKSIIIYDTDIINKGLDTPPHISVGGDLISLLTTFTAIQDFQKNVKRLIRQIEIKLSIDETSAAPDKSDFIVKIISSFHTVALQLQNRHSKRSTISIVDEYDVQDLFHALLRMEFADVRAEEYTPSYAGSSTRMDFLLKKEKTVIEVKKTRDTLKDKEVGDQLIIDIQHYKAHPDCKHLICFIYDPENKIKNPRGLEADLNALSSDDLSVAVYIKP